MLLDRLMVALHHALEDEDGNPRKINEVYRDGSFYATTQTLSNTDQGKLNQHRNPQTSALHQVRQPNHHHTDPHHNNEQLHKNNKNIVSLLQPSSELSSASMLGEADEFSPTYDSENGIKIDFGGIGKQKIFNALHFFFFPRFY